MLYYDYQLIDAHISKITILKLSLDDRMATCYLSGGWLFVQPCGRFELPNLVAIEVVIVLWLVNFCFR
jgi:hypothetical protein